eukprot:8502234-Pyramimonas_sp.AAC.1
MERPQEGRQDAPSRRPGCSHGRPEEQRGAVGSLEAGGPDILAFPSAAAAAKPGRVSCDGRASGDIDDAIAVADAAADPRSAAS